MTHSSYYLIFKLSWNHDLKQNEKILEAHKKRAHRLISVLSRQCFHRWKYKAVKIDNLYISYCKSRDLYSLRSWTPTTLTACTKQCHFILSRSHLYGFSRSASFTLENSPVRCWCLWRQKQIWTNLAILFQCSGSSRYGRGQELGRSLRRRRWCRNANFQTKFVIIFVKLTFNRSFDRISLFWEKYN